MFFKRAKRFVIVKIVKKFLGQNYNSFSECQNYYYKTLNAIFPYYSIMVKADDISVAFFV